MIHVGQSAPAFARVTAYQRNYEGFRQVSLADYRGKWVVLFFYPRDFTFICPTEIEGFAQQEEAFRKLGTEILAASTDSEWSHQAWFTTDPRLQQVAYPVLADTNHRLAREYDVYNEEAGLAERGLFIIDPQGVVQYALVSAGAVGRSVEETLRVVQALQSGELCPINWRPGQKTLGKA
ncbi:peroxiredoxin [Candidatus Uhrbacteria bacterium]|nr:peroxiredoxin [Candidatus Uhrbacteria bacterium]